MWNCYQWILVAAAAVAIGAGLAGCSDSGSGCVPHEKTTCDDGVVYWVDSCGNVQEPQGTCPCGCQAQGSDCRQCECTSRASKECHQDAVWWYDSCGQPEELIVNCPNGCAQAECLDCQPACSGKDCGPDGCGGLCGRCDAGLVCQTSTGQCLAECQPDCQGRECGDDGCGASCGTCTGGRACEEGSCVCTHQAFQACHDDDVWWFDSCGNPDGLATDCPHGCADGICQGCDPTTCEAEGAGCGTIPDGCGDVLDCGTCTPPETCAGAGVENQCGCTPTTCEQQGADCGSIDDGCTGTLECGGCPPPMICAADQPNVCGCRVVISGGSLEVPIPVAHVLLDVTLGGQALSASNCGDYDEGRLVLLDPVTGERSELEGVWDDNANILLTPYHVQIVPGTYDIYYAVVDDGPNWPSNVNRLLQAGVAFQDGGMLTVDVPVANLSLGVTLDGEALSAANCGDYDEGMLVLVDPSTGERSELGGVWDDNANTLFTPYNLQIVPGAYDIYYSVVDDGPHWPSNVNRLLQAGVWFQEGGAQTVDVPVADATVDVTLDGEALSAANCGDYDEGRLVLLDPVTGERSELEGVWDDNANTLFTPYDLQIVPGTYDIYYAVVDDGSHWPSNVNRLLRSGVSFQDGGMLTVDVPVADATVGVTLDGEALSAANCGDYDEGMLVLVDPATGERSELGGVWDDNANTLFTPYDLQIVPGTYDVYYAVVDDGPHWPSNTARLLQAGVAFQDGAELSMDVPVAALSVDVTLGGEPLSAANCGDYDEGMLVLLDPVTGERSELGSVWDDNANTLLTPYAVQIVPGTYDIYYAVVDDGSHWPSNVNRLLESGVSFQDGAGFSVDVPVAFVSIQVTLGGEALSAANCGDYDEGMLVLVDPDTGERSELGGVWDDNANTLLTPYAVQIVPGTYDIYYTVVDDGPNWPSNTNVLLSCISIRME